MDHSRAIALLESALRCESHELDESYRFYSERRFGGVTLTLTKRMLTEVLARLNQRSPHQNLSLYHKTGMETLVREENPVPIRRFRDEGLRIEDSDNGVTYAVSAASDEYMLFYLDLIEKNSEMRFFTRLGLLSSMIERKIAEQGGAPSVFDLARLTFPRMLTIKVSSINETSAVKLSRLASAFLFQIAFNTDVALVPQRELDALSRAGRISRMRRNEPSEIDPPRRMYNDDLIHHYLLAVSTDNAVVEYLSHYHVLEHFYESVFNDELVYSIQSQMTQPDFSYKRKKDVQGLISTIRKSLKVRNETITFSEDEALRLTLTKFVNISSLTLKLQSYDASLIEFYRTSKVTFSGGSEVDLLSTDVEDVFRRMGRRIYQTRNALIHSKDGEKMKYTPFVDDHVLSKELPLLRFIAEDTILKNSSLIE